MALVKLSAPVPERPVHIGLFTQAQPVKAIGWGRMCVGSVTEKANAALGDSGGPRGWPRPAASGCWSACAATASLSATGFRRRIWALRRPSTPARRRTSAGS